MDNFYQQYYKGTRAFVSKKIDDNDLVEELTNDILLAAWKAWPTFNHKSSEFSFICSIAKHKIVDYYRKKKLKTVLFSASPVFEEIADKALSPERDVLKNELVREINLTLKDLKAGYGKILRLKYIDGLRVAKIATLMKMSVKAVESRLIRAKKQFRNRYSYDKKTSKEIVAIRTSDRD